MAIGPYTPVVKAGDFLIVSGQLGLGENGLVEGVRAQVTQAMHNLGALLNSKEAGLHNLVKTTVFLTDMANYAEMNEAYLAFFDGAPPARSAVAVAGLPLGALVEIEGWAYHPGAGASFL